MKAHILIVEDQETLAQLYKFALEARGYRVTAFTRGPSALSYLRGAPAPDMLIVDYSMPEMSGEDLISEIRRHCVHVSTESKIIGFSSFSADLEILSGFRSIVDQFVQKPADLDTFLEIVSRLVPAECIEHLPPNAVAL